MFFECPHCRKTAQAELEMQGQLVECQHCGETVQVPYRVSPRKAIVQKKNDLKKQEENTNLCFTLGLLFSVLGILIAAIIGKVNGVKAALKGFVINLVIGVILALI